MQSLVVAYNSGEPQCLKPYSALQSLMADQVEGTVAVAEPVRDASPHGAYVAELQTKSGRYRGLAMDFNSWVQSS